MNKENFAELNRIVKSDDVTDMKSFIKHHAPSGVKIDKAFMDLSKERGYSMLGLCIQFSAIQCIELLLSHGAKSIIIRTEKFDTMIAACIDYHVKIARILHIIMLRILNISKRIHRSSQYSFAS